MALSTRLSNIEQEGTGPRAEPCDQTLFCLLRQEHVPTDLLARLSARPPAFNDMPDQYPIRCQW